MTKREARRMACALAASLLHAETHQDGAIQARMEHLNDADFQRVLFAVRELAAELASCGDLSLGKE